jgi:drug/metabolite transporter (DMT)-like permease
MDNLAQGMNTAVKGQLYIWLAVLGFGFNPLFARWAYADILSPETVIIYRILFPFLLLTPFVWSGLRWNWPTLAALLIGALISIGTLTYFRALAVLPVATAALVYYTYPLFTILLGWLFFGEKMTKEALLTIFLILVACSLILSPRGLSVTQVSALLLSFLMPLTYALLLQGFQHWLGDIPLIQRMALLKTGQVLTIIPLFWIVRPPLLPTSSIGWLGIIGLATVSSMLPQIFMSIGIPLAGATRAAILGSAELIVVLLVGWVLLHEPVQLREILGGGLIMSAILFQQWRSSPKVVV